MTMHTPAAISATDVTVRRRTWPGLCTFIQPLIGVRQVTRGFCFFEASVLLIEQGSLAFDAGDHQGVAGGPDSLLCVDQDYRCDMIKTPDADFGVFQSLFICIDEAVISEFALQQRVSGVVKAPQARTVPLDDVLADTWRFPCVRSRRALRSAMAKCGIACWACCWRCRSGANASVYRRNVWPPGFARCSQARSEERRVG